MNFKKVHPDFGIEIKDIKINKANKKEISKSKLIEITTNNFNQLFFN